MAITETQNNGNGVLYRANGSYLDDAATPEAMVITCGFTPKYVRVVNETDRTQTEKFESMVDANTLKIAANGDATLATDSAIIFNEKGFTFLKALTIQNKQYRWIAEA
jgi:hypothetical protein